MNSNHEKRSTMPYKARTASGGYQGSGRGEITPSRYFYVRFRGIVELVGSLKKGCFGW